MTPAERAQVRIQQVANRLSPKLRARFLRYIEALRPADTRAMVAAIEAGNIDAAVATIFSQPASRAADSAVRSAFADVLNSTTRLLTGEVVRELRVIVAAPVGNADMLAAVSRWNDVAFRRVKADIRASVREHIAAELAQGVGPRQVAVALKQDIARAGLTAYDAKLVRSFRTALDEGRTGDALRRALRDKRFDKSVAKGTYTPAQIETMTDAYRRKLVAFRADTFARTAAIQAANESSGIGWRAAVEQGGVPYDEVRRYWVVAADERLCDRCMPIPNMNPHGVRLDEPFLIPGGVAMTPPLHPNCRCTVWVRRERAGVKREAQPGVSRLVLPRS